MGDYTLPALFGTSTDTPQPSGPISKGTIDRRRRLAEALMASGSSAEPVQSWTQAAARLAQALSGNAWAGRADKMEQDRNAAMMEAFRGAGGDPMKMAEVGMAYGEPTIMQGGMQAWQYGQRQQEPNYHFNEDTGQTVIYGPNGTEVRGAPENYQVPPTKSAQQGTWEPVDGSPGLYRNTVTGEPKQVNTPEYLSAKGDAQAGAKEKAAWPKLKSLANSSIDQLKAQDAALAKIESVISENPNSSYGMTGNVLSKVSPGGMPVDTIQANIDTVNANTAFQSLQEMRQNSPTGASLGPVSDFENKLLAASKGAFNIKSPDFPAQVAARRQAVQQLIKDLETRRDEDAKRFGEVTVNGTEPNAGAQVGETKEIGGKKYQKINGQWFEVE